MVTLGNPRPIHESNLDRVTEALFNFRPFTPLNYFRPILNSSQHGCVFVEKYCKEFRPISQVCSLMMGEKRETIILERTFPRDQY